MRYRTLRNLYSRPMDQDINSLENSMLLHLFHTILEGIIQVENLIKNSCTSPVLTESLVMNRGIFWTASKTDLIEVIYASDACNLLIYPHLPYEIMEPCLFQRNCVYYYNTCHN